MSPCTPKPNRAKLSRRQASAPDRLQVGVVPTEEQRKAKKTRTAARRRNMASHRAKLDGQFELTIHGHVIKNAIIHFLVETSPDYRVPIPEIGMGKKLQETLLQYRNRHSDGKWDGKFGGFEVRRIISHRWEHNKLWYYIQWGGEFSEEVWNTEVRPNSLKDTDLLAEYNEQNGIDEEMMKRH